MTPYCKLEQEKKILHSSNNNDNNNKNNNILDLFVFKLNRESARNLY